MSALLVALSVIVFFALAVWLSVRLARRDDGRLRLLEATRAQGVALPEPDGDLAVQDRALAVRRCVLCTEHSRCDAILAARDWPALREICPNTAFIDRLQRDARPEN